MADVIAKFRVTSVEYYEHPPKSHRVKMAAVYPRKDESGWDENKKFHEATPSGNVEMFISNPAVFETFHPGDEFYAEFTRAPKT
jgi:hypothetical protein